MKTNTSGKIPLAETVVLLSGGVESVTLLHQEHRSGTIAALFVNYAQRAAKREHWAAMTQCLKLGIPMETLDLSHVGLCFSRAYRQWRPHIPLPHRNLVLLSLALSFADASGATRLCLALNREDVDLYPGSSSAFINDFRLLTADLTKITVETPLITLRKAEIIQLGLRLGVNYAETYSCLLGRQRPCGRCPQCLRRQQAFAISGRPDPGTDSMQKTP